MPVMNIWNILILAVEAYIYKIKMSPFYLLQDAAIDSAIDP